VIFVHIVRHLNLYRDIFIHYFIKPAVCIPYPERVWPDNMDNNEMDCKSADGTQLDYPNGLANGFPEGTVCQAKCKETEIYGTWFSQTSKCECNDAGRCVFDENKIKRCEVAACTPDINALIGTFAEGFVNKNVIEGNDEAQFAELDCDEYWPDNHEDIRVAGKVKYGSKVKIFLL